MPFEIKGAWQRARARSLREELGEADCSANRMWLLSCDDRGAEMGP